MGIFVQKVALDFGEQEMRLFVHDTQEYTEELQQTLYMEFCRSRFRLGQAKTKNKPFSEMISHGVIKDEVLLSSYIRFVLSRLGLGKFAFARIDLMLAVPTETSQVTKLLWTQVLERIGISKVTFVSSAIAGALGAGYAFPIPTVALVIHLGASTSEISAVSLHECLFSLPLRLTSQAVFERIRAQFFWHTRHELSSREWKSIESSIGALLLTGGKSLETTSERRKRLERVTLDTIFEFGQELLCDVEIALEKLSVEELSLCSTQGIVLTGTLATQEGFAQFLSRNLSIPVYSASDPEMAIVRGESALLTFLEQEEKR